MHIPTTNFGGDPQQITLDHFHHLSFLDTEDETERLLNARYTEVAMHVLRQVFEELIKLFEAWADREYVHRLYKYWQEPGDVTKAVRESRKTFSLTAMSKVTGIDTRKLLCDFRCYKPEWKVYDWCWTKDAAMYFHSFNLEPADFIEAAKDFAFDVRQPGVDESWLWKGSQDHLPHNLHTNIFDYKRRARRKLKEVYAAA